MSAQVPYKTDPYPSVGFKSSLEYLYYLLQYKCYVNSCLHATKLSFAFVFQLPGIWLGLRLLKLIEYDWSSRSGQTQLWTHHYLSISPFGNPCLFCKEAQTALWSVSSRKNVNLNNKFSWAPSHQPARVLLPMWKRNLGNESSNPVLSLMTNELSK